MPDKTPTYSQTGEVPRAEAEEALRTIRCEAALTPDLPALPGDVASTGMIPRSILLSSEDGDGGAPRDVDSPGGV
ncbi:MAG: hypothetical protein NZ750_11845 [Anaerolineae bacterium]|nr:hypothetical protein [Anaerolineae bacterium]MDW8173946.1 hypothetical protein [Anaerolineae bacterium]